MKKKVRIYRKITDEDVFWRYLTGNVIVFIKKTIFTNCQSGFLACDSWFLQLLAIVHDINSSFYCDHEHKILGVYF